MMALLRGIAMEVMLGQVQVVLVQQMGMLMLCHKRS
jgi:hypothetical protein